jgi:hypothetical protein
VTSGPRYHSTIVPCYHATTLSQGAGACDRQATLRCDHVGRLLQYNAGTEADMWLWASTSHAATLFGKQ